MKILCSAIILSSATLFCYATNATTPAMAHQSNHNKTEHAKMKNANTQNILLRNSQKTVAISFPANATTGYQWFSKNYDHNLLTLKGYQYAPESTKRMGAGGTATFEFTINPQFYAAPQTTKLTFVYQQPWSPGQNTSNTTVILTSTGNNNLSEAKDAMNTAKKATTNKNWLSLPSAMQTES